MIASKWRDIVLAVALAYTGIGLLAASYVFGGRSPVGELLSTLGLAIIVSAIVWILVVFSERRLESQIRNAFLFSQAGISDLKLLTSTSTAEEIETYVRRSFSLRIALGYSMPSQRMISLFQMLKETSRSAQVLMLIPDPESPRLQSSNISRDYIANRSLVDQIVSQHIGQPPEQHHIRITNLPPNNGFILTEEWVIIFLDPPLYTRGESLLIRASAFSSLGRAYDQIFDTLWSYAREARMETGKG